jgi:hypothetical protein
VARFVGDRDVEDGVYIVLGGPLGVDGTPSISERLNAVQLQQIQKMIELELQALGG